MALETLKGVLEITGFHVVDMCALREQFPEKFNATGGMDYAWFEKEIRPHNYIYIRHDVNSISFTLQNGPVKENGVNGCQVDALIATAARIIHKLNIQNNCAENYEALYHLQRALDFLDERRKNREARGVEGTNKP